MRTPHVGAGGFSSQLRSNPPALVLKARYPGCFFTDMDDAETRVAAVTALIERLKPIAIRWDEGSLTAAATYERLTSKRWRPRLSGYHNEPICPAPCPAALRIRAPFPPTRLAVAMAAQA